ncbi:hypothetical protein PtA15_14A450 [Puccinia triticina]|uniref:Uncharacterized protein n=1 Tax=Puccinia triticina TaxID=208348 RepID=A0ABY7D1V6_9BASI|nr:uncharacterized protein PtA15_14A450 [Puccinia triticina]WAQ91566.1 hypothetical protein PtA15_14A450 [Puccinia triticina]
MVPNTDPATRNTPNTPPTDHPTMAKSNIPSQNQDDQATKNERDRFRLLHRNLRNCEQSFNDFLKAVGLEKVRQYNDEVFQAVPPASNKLFGLSWVNFINVGNFERLQESLIDPGGHKKKKGKKEKLKLIRCAYLLRFPADTNYLKMGVKDMLAQLQKPGSTTPAQDVTARVEDIDWSTDVVQEGFSK